MPAAGARRRAALAAAVGLLVVAVQLVLPTTRVVLRTASGRLVLETTVTLVGALAALLVYGRYRRTAALRELLLVHALALLALTALLLVAVPAVLEPARGQATSGWAAVVVRLLGAVLLVVAATVRPGRRHRLAHPAREPLAFVLGLVLVAALVDRLASGLPDVVSVATVDGRPQLSGQPLVALAVLANLGCLAAAAVLLAGRARELAPGVWGWLAPAAALGACGRLATLVLPTPPVGSLSASDALRAGMYVLLGVGAVAEIRSAWQEQAALAVLDERRRLARDLHDGVVQELGLIRTWASRWPGEDGAQVAAAAERAVDEARRAVHALAADVDEPLAGALSRAVQDVQTRYGVPVRAALDEQVRLEPDAREALVRIAREACLNAAKHARTPHVHVELGPGRLVVSDHGHGFDPALGREGGFGLTSMRDRAQGMDADLSIESRAGEGTRVEVSW